MLRVLRGESGDLVRARLTERGHDDLLVPLLDRPVGHPDQPAEHLTGRGTDDPRRYRLGGRAYP